MIPNPTIQMVLVEMWILYI